MSDCPVVSDYGVRFVTKRNIMATAVASFGSRPRLLDLFCCAGGASTGYSRAGFDVVGVDIDPQPNYRFSFIQADAMRLDPMFISTFDAVHASPPCQSYSDLAKRNGNADAWPRLIDPVRDLLVRSGLPYIIENVEGAPLRNPIVLCGTMFKGLRVLRHRLFETSFPILTPKHGTHPKVHTFDKRKSHYGKTDDMRDFVQVTGGGNCTIAAARDAMGIDWMTKNELNEAIPQLIQPSLVDNFSHICVQRSRSNRSFTIMRKPGSKERIRQFFLANIGRVIASTEIRDAAGSNVSEWARRVRELREDEGWPILTHNDNAGLKPGQYLLREAPPTKSDVVFSRSISAKLRAEVLDRNGFTCQMCGLTPGDLDPSTGRKVRLHIGHIVDKSIGGKEELSNLRSLCSTCNQGAKNITTVKPPAIWLLSQIRRAGLEEQREVLTWLRNKFKE